MKKFIIPAAVVAVLGGIARDNDLDTALFGEFDGISNQIGKDLLESERIPNQHFRYRLLDNGLQR